MRKIKLQAAFLLLLCISCSLPKDPENSYSEAKSDKLMVGYVHHPPYTYTASGTAEGMEIHMIDEFAKTEGFSVEYIYGTESELVKKMENYHLHLLIGGLKKNTHWKDKAGLSVPYNNNNNCFLVARGENKLLYKLESYLFTYKEKNGN